MLETIPEEGEPQMDEKQNLTDQDTVLFMPDESEEEPFNTAIDDTSDPTIVMGKLVTTAFISDDICIPTEKVGCSQVTILARYFCLFLRLCIIHCAVLGKVVRWYTSSLLGFYVHQVLFSCSIETVLIM